MVGWGENKGEIQKHVILKNSLYLNDITYYY